VLEIGPTGGVLSASEFFGTGVGVDIGIDSDLTTTPEGKRKEPIAMVETKAKLR
jgi:hypothetical protein